MMSDKVYSIILNNRDLSDAILASDKSNDCQHYKTNGFDGEIFDVFKSNVNTIIGILTLIAQCYQIWQNHKFQTDNTINEEKEKVNYNVDDIPQITIIGPDGFEYRNVPINQVSYLIGELKKLSEGH